MNFDVLYDASMSTYLSLFIVYDFNFGLLNDSKTQMRCVCVCVRLWIEEPIHLHTAYNKPEHKTTHSKWINTMNVISLIKFLFHRK